MGIDRIYKIVHNDGQSMLTVFQEFGTRNAQRTDGAWCETIATNMGKSRNPIHRMDEVLLTRLFRETNEVEARLRPKPSDGTTDQLERFRKIIHQCDTTRGNLATALDQLLAWIDSQGGLSSLDTTLPPPEEMLTILATCKNCRTAAQAALTELRTTFGED